jgi:hypothetical protein
MGMLHGASALPKRWTDPLNDLLESGVSGYSLVKISELAKQTVELKV